MKTQKEYMQTWLLHIAGWLFFVILPIFVFGKTDAQTGLWRNQYYFQLFFAVLIFYGNYSFIAPRYFFSGKWIRYSIILIIFSLSMILLFQVLSNKFGINRPPIDPQFNAPPPGRAGQMHSPPFRPSLLHPRMFDDALFVILILGFSTGMYAAQRSFREKTLQKDMEKVRVETELAFLKNQINPHFFFNSLNNIYALIAIDSEAAQKTVEKLSGLMRYLIYESNVKTVPLHKEIDFTRNYIDLMKQRLTPKVKLSIDIQDDIPAVEIPPLIFIPFVENAFKHGISYRDESFISIALRLHNDTIYFLSKNSIQQSKNSRNGQGGIGIENIKKRLKLLYSGKAKLIHKASEKTFTIELTLPAEIPS